MSNITYIKGDLFKLAPANSNLAHACNCQGIWGGGIAVQFRKRYPESYQEYINICLKYSPDENVGQAFITSEGVVCLLTSQDYGEDKDDVETILENTIKALNRVHEYLGDGGELHMPKINSGLFGVPWSSTEEILKQFDGKLKFFVYEL